ncbi:hypothetical protein B2J93_5191 [Marssonina coronariae]|uniref:F-box domain-containing protein n=1 Tax=Diplocarpon coronariae TaxID=2795749 RepID=A0A218ZG31_9HELO|nr:hypothetical protein B2J93_5191 [Marssonina coronariae]
MGNGNSKVKFAKLKQKLKRSSAGELADPSVPAVASEDSCNVSPSASRSTAGTEVRHIKEGCRRIAVPSWARSHEPDLAKLFAARSSINFGELPLDIIAMISRDYLDTCSKVCLGLTCKTMRNVLVDFTPAKVNLHLRTSGVCLGRLLTTWMQRGGYTFDHSWCTFRKTRSYEGQMAKEQIERRWMMKESWKTISFVRDSMGSRVAFGCKCGRCTKFPLGGDHIERLDE